MPITTLSQTNTKKSFPPEDLTEYTVEVAVKSPCVSVGKLYRDLGPREPGTSHHGKSRLSYMVGSLWIYVQLNTCTSVSEMENCITQGFCVLSHTGGW